MANSKGSSSSSGNSKKKNANQGIKMSNGKVVGSGSKKKK